MNISAHTPKLLACIAPDGEHVTEGRPNDPYHDTDAAWRRADDMGSRWFFYPIHVVITPGGYIADVPRGMQPEWIGRRLSTLRKAIAACQEETEAYIQGKAPFFVFP